MAEIVYARVSQILEDEFSLLGTDAARTPITGKVDADFTKTLSRGTTTGLSVTNVVITEIGLGKYDVTIAASVLATTGVYTLRISITVAGIAYVFEAIYVITSDGTPSGTFGTASFTATASNGRTTNGTTALSGVTVYIRDPSSNLYTSTTSDASGLWGPVYFTTNGTYTVYAQKSGYMQAAASILVSGASATLSPATDMALSAVSTGSGLIASDLTAYARRMALDRTGTKADTEILQSVNMALDMVSKARLWPMYVTRGQLSLKGQYTTGTVSVSVGSATATLVGGTFPTWASSAKILIGGQVYATIANPTTLTVTLEATWSDATITGAQSYVLFQDTYALPDNMSKFGRLLPGQRWPYGGDPVGPEVLFESQMILPMGLRGPTCWAFVSTSIAVYPYPSQDILCGYWYYRRPTPLVGPTDAADWDVQQLELLRRAIDYQVAILYGEYAGGSPEQAMGRFQEALGRAVPMDRTAASTADIMVPPMMGGDIPLWLKRTS